MLPVSPGVRGSEMLCLIILLIARAEHNKSMCAAKSRDEASEVSYAKKETLAYLSHKFGG